MRREEKKNWPEEEDLPDLLRDHPFNPWREPRTERAKAVVQDVVNQLQDYEVQFQLRQRKRRKADQETFEATISALVCDLIHHHLTASGNGVFITRSHVQLGQVGRYKPRAFSKTLPDILNRLSSPELAFLEQKMGHKGFFGPARKTTIRAGERLITQILEHGITLDDLKRSDNEEVIHLKRTKDGYWDEASLIDYEDTPTTTLYREQMGKINSWLEQADLEFDESCQDEDCPVDVTGRRLHRVFTRGRFDRGGRLFGGFWLGLKKTQRRKGLLINGEEAVELDFSQMGPRIIYGLCGRRLPMNDAYTIPGFEAYRPGIKKVMNSMFFVEAPLTRMPRGVREEFEDNHSIAGVTNAIEAAHPAIKQTFYTGIGHEVQFIESQILVDILLSLIDQGTTALPIHDAILVPASRKEISKKIMLSIFSRHAGVKGLIKEDG